jgi:anaerobic magnesium-protoporphyrin IX monomethyl ester cyclase
LADILLTHSYHLANDAKQFRKMQPYPPLATLYAATALQSAGMSVAVCDTMFVEPESAFRAALSEHQPKIVVIYEDDFNFVTKMCLKHMRELAKKIAAVAHTAGILVVAHGSDATDHPEEYLDHSVAYILNGEVEASLVELCSALLSSRAVKTIAGLVRYTGDGKLERQLPAPTNPAWARLSRPARELIDMEPYRQAWVRAHGYFSTNIVASRGCPYGCNWCAKPISGSRFQLREPEEVAAELEILRTEYGVEHVWFSDDVFALDRHWVEQFACSIESSGGLLPFKIQSRADLLTDTTVACLKRAGCAEVWMGVESGSQKILDAMKKGLKLPAVYSARQRLTAASIRACFFLQFGYPGERWNEICETVQMVRDTRPDDIGVSISYPLPGTGFFDRVKERLGETLNWADSDDLRAIHTAAYTDSFYHALRDALHVEVDGWNAPAASTLDALWKRVHEMEPACRNSDALLLDMEPSPPSKHSFLPLENILIGASTT